ncbi:MAG TPA: SpoIIE family protein phosphatase [Opitutaceae bacterium]
MSSPVEASSGAVVSAQLCFQRLMETLPAHVYFKDLEGRFICLNRALAQKFGLSSPADAVGRSDYDFFPRDLAQQKDADEREIVRTGVGIVDKEEPDWTDPTRRQWCLTTKLPLRGADGAIIGTFGISRDITETKLAHEALEDQHRLLSTLIEILPCRIFVKNRSGQIELTNEAYRREIGLSSADQIEGRTLSELVPPERGAQAAADDTAVINEGVSIINREQHDTSSLHPDRWVLLSKVPLRDCAGNIRGLVGMAADITAQKEAEAQANRARLELQAKNTQMEEELAVARDLQRELMEAELRRVNETLRWQNGRFDPLTLHYEASEQLAGDFVHALPLTPTRFGLFICDVMGHGVRASLVTALIRGLLANQRLRDLDPGELLGRLNARLCVLLDQPVMPRFVTALYATIDLKIGAVKMADAGHPWPLLQRAGGRVLTMQSGPCDPALGLIPETSYTTSTHVISPGDRLLLLTDGWLEEANEAGEEFGRDRLAELFGHAPADPEKALDLLAHAVQHHANGQHCRDDLCAVLLQV